MSEEIFAIFNSVHRVLKAQKVLKGKGVPVVTVPVPRRISADCGIALSFPSKFTKEVQAALAAATSQPTALYRKNPDSTFTKL